MEWLSALMTLITTGGLVTLATLRDKKTAAILDNYDRIIKSWEQSAQERRERAQELKEDITKKDAKIDELYAEISVLRKDLDSCRTKRAVAEVLKCVKLSCVGREPPYGNGADLDVKFKDTPAPNIGIEDDTNDKNSEV